MIYRKSQYGGDIQMRCGLRMKILKSHLKETIRILTSQSPISLLVLILREKVN